MSDDRQRGRHDASHDPVAHDPLASQDPVDRALGHWPATEPPAGFAEAVLARLDAAADGPSPAADGPSPVGVGRVGVARWPALAAAVAAGALLALGSSWWLGAAAPEAGARGGGPSSGEHVADRRSTLSLGRRAVAVAEPGLALAWRVARGGATRVEQRRGAVFYRVARGERPFVVHTPVGRVRVLGTCFRVEVSRMSKRSRVGLAGAAAGAALASVVLVTVYEGKVQLLTAKPRGEVDVGPGQAARVAAGERPRRLDAERRRADEQGTAARPARGAAAPAPHASAGPAALARDNRTLREQVDQLQQALAKAQQGGRDSKVTGLSKQDLRAMAKRCELRWDYPGLSSEPPKTPSKAVTELGLNDTEKAAVDQVLARYHARMVKALRALYVEVTGDRAGADALSPAALKREIVDKSPRAEVKQTFAKLSRERAGLQAPPPAGSEQGTVERLYRLLTGAGDWVEKEIGAQIGPDLARRARELNGGWGSRSRASYGCP